jgi:hypothetical protein
MPVAEQCRKGYSMIHREADSQLHTTTAREMVESVSRPDALEFIVKCGLMKTIAEIIEIVRKHFESDAPITIRKRSEVDFDGEYLQVEFQTRYEAQRVVELYMACRDALSSLIPGEQLNLISLSFDIIDS